MSESHTIDIKHNQVLTGLRIGTWKAIVDWSKAALGRGNEENVPLQKARREDWK